MIEQKGSQDLLNYIVTQANSGNKDWFGFQQQRIAGINMAYEIAKHHADKLSPDEVVEYVARLNNAIFEKLIKVAK
jgi:hypothetical protein